MERTASAAVSGHETQATFTVSQPYGRVGQWDDLWTRNYTVTVNPCDGTFEGTGRLYDNVGAFYADETIIGRFTETSVSLTATRQSDGVMYSLADAPFGGAMTLGTTIPQVNPPVEMKVTTPEFSGFKN